MKASSKATYPFIGVLEQLTTNAQRSFTSRILVDWCGWCGFDNHGLGCYGWCGMILWLLFWCHSLMCFWWYGQAAKLLRQRFQALKTKRENRRFGNGCLFFFGVRINYHTIQTWLEITVKLESEKPGLDIWKFISHASSQINHWGIRALCRIMGMRATFFLTIFLHATLGDALVTLV